MTDIPAPAIRPAASSTRRFKTARTVIALIMREMQTTYGRNVGGYAWALLEPIGGIAFFTAAISIGLRIREPALGNSFALFYATGFLALSMFLGVSGKVASALQFSRPLLKYPGVEFSDAILARFLLTTMTQLMVALIIFSGIHILFEIETILNVEAIVAGLLLAALLGLGIGVVNCYLFSVMPLWQSAWGILTRPLFLFSTIFFTFEDVPKEFQDELWWNPIVHCVGFLRRGFYATYDAPWVSGVYLVLLSLALTLIGLALLRRFHGDILNR